MLVLNDNGEYAIQILSAKRPKIAAGDKNKATPEENAALVQGNNSHFGTFKVEEKLHTITFRLNKHFTQIGKEPFRNGAIFCRMTN